MNLELFLQIPFDKLTNLKAIVVEHEENRQIMKDTMAKYNFKCISENAENLVFTK